MPCPRSQGREGVGPGLQARSPARRWSELCFSSQRISWRLPFKATFLRGRGCVSSSQEPAAFMPRKENRKMSL